MRPLKLFIEGVNSFKQMQCVDFEELATSNIFCITGNTGSGKTTILDCIILSLYGGGKRCGKLEDYINLLVDSAFVALEFEADYNGVRRFRVEREFFRGNKPNKATLISLDDNQIMDTGVDAVNLRILEMIGLSREDFTKVVILEQGEFDKFLNSQKAERLKTVSNLFKLQRFDELTKKVNTKIKAVETEIANLDKILQPLGDLTKDKIAMTEKESKELEEKKSALDKEEKAMTAKKDSLLTEKGKWEEFDKAVKSLPELLIKVNAAKEEKDKADAEFGSIKTKGVEIDKKRESRGKIEQQIENLEKLKPKAEELKSVNAELEKLRKEYKLKEDERKSSEKKTAETELKLNEHNRNIEKHASVALTVKSMTEKYLIGKQKALEEAKERLDRQKSMNAAAAVAAELKYGDDCPVCGGVFHAAVCSGGDLGNFLQAAELARKDCDNADKLCREFDGLYDYVAENCQYELKANEFNGDELKAIEFMRSFKKCLKDADEEKKAYERQSSELKLLEKDCENLQSEGKSLREKFDGLKKDLGDVTDIDAKIKESRQSLSDLDEEIAKFEHDRTNVEERQHQSLAILTQVNSQYEDCYKKTKFKPDFDAEVYQKIEERLKEIKEEIKSANEKSGEISANLKTMKGNLETKKKYESEKRGFVKNLDSLKILSNIFFKNAFMDFVSEEYIEDFTESASERMSELSNGKFTLEYIGGDFYVRDFLRANEKRKVGTLSGGETFLCSLSMAIAISREIARYRNFEFFFLDEGFGTLHVDAIDTVSDALTALSFETMVGIVTHRSELVERIAKKIEVIGADIDVGSVIV